MFGLEVRLGGGVRLRGASWRGCVWLGGGGVFGLEVRLGGSWRGLFGLEVRLGGGVFGLEEGRVWLRGA